MSIVLLLFAVSAAFAQVRGFPAEALKEFRQRELQARSLPEASRIRTYMKRMSSEPHHAGSPGSKAVAEYAFGLFREWGIDARIETFEALLPYPTTRIVEMVEPVRYRATLKETAMPEDGDSGDANQLPTFNAYSGSGDVTAPLLYVNYGLREDYEYLKRLGIDAKGKIVIARYGRSWRGTKPKVAAEQGALGCIIYSDPRDDGYFQGDIYPLGPYRPPQGVQRGSVMDMPVQVGDPLSPGWASEPGSRRLKIEDAQTLMKIPVLPMSYEDAGQLMRHLGGPVAPEPWRGALGQTYHIGPGQARVHLKLEFDNSTRPLYNVIATLPGSEFPDQWILYGNHHDAWVNGANDPISGASALLETARTLAEMRKRGWKPKRTIKFALWDAEEYGLVGSTEWVEKHIGELQQKMVAYLNSDSTGKGRIQVGGTPSMESFVAELLHDLQDPVSRKPLMENRRARSEAAKSQEFHLDPLGAGSDYVAFVHHAGIPALNFGFGGEGGGVYHSIYDSFAWYTKYSDSDFSYSRTFSSLAVSMVMRLADAALLPFEFSAQHRALQRWVDEISKAAGKDNTKLDWKELHTDLGRFLTAAKLFETEYQAAIRRWQKPGTEKLGQLNQAMFQAEHALLLPSGLPGRQWYKHPLSAPGLYTGYGAKTLPAVREAVEAGHFAEASQNAREAAKSLRNLTAEINRITGMLRGL